MIKMKLSEYIRQQKHVEHKPAKKDIRYNIHNNSLQLKHLHGERFFDWFDKEFNIAPIP